MAEAIIIMAGGVGSRLWPASLAAQPKQLLRIGGGQSLIQQAVLRGAAACPDGPIVIVTNEQHVAPIQPHIAELREVAPGVPGRVEFVAEPVGRNTAPAIALGVTKLGEKLPSDATVLVLTADHVIEPVSAFASDANRATQLARAGYLVCFGIVPDRPETGYGYIHAGSPLDGGSTVQAFTEKPDSETARRYLEEGGYYWNSGMFAFSLGQFQNELAAHAPEVSTAFAALDTEDPGSLREAYEALPKISIDYALMERSSSVAVVPATFRWSDVGSWDEAAKLGQGGARLRTSGDGVGTSPIEIEASGNHIDSDLPVAVCGVSDIHVVVKNGKVLVCRRGESQLVKQVVDVATEREATEFLQ
jgi:mannose-1-phosphate guanylyltransferase/mannose-6-phosphate isomerase